MHAVELHPAAASEILEALAYYENVDSGLVVDLDQLIDQKISQIANSPMTWPVYLYGTHRLMLKRFPFSLIYRIRVHQIQVVAFAHHKRKPGYWQDRI